MIWLKDELSACNELKNNYIGCVSTQRHKRVSNVGFDNRDFTSLSLKKIKEQGRFEPSSSCLKFSTSLNLKSMP